MNKKLNEIRNYVSKIEQTVKENLKPIGLGIIILLLLVGGFFYLDNQRRVQGQSQEKSNQQLKQELKDLIKDSNEKIQEQLKQQDKKIEEVKVVKAQRKLEQQSLASRKLPVRSVSGGCGAYRSLLDDYGWNVDIAVAVCNAESGGNPTVVSPTNDHGLMQLHGIPIYDPAANISYAYYEKYLKGGWSHWSVCKSIKGAAPIVRCA